MSYGCCFITTAQTVPEQHLLNGSERCKVSGLCISIGCEPLQTMLYFGSWTVEGVTFCFTIWRELIHRRNCLYIVVIYTWKTRWEVISSKSSTAAIWSCQRFQSPWAIAPKSQIVFNMRIYKTALGRSWWVSIYIYIIWFGGAHIYTKGMPARAARVRWKRRQEHRKQVDPCEAKEHLLGWRPGG